VVRDVVLCADLGSGSLRVGAFTATGSAIATTAVAMTTAAGRASPAQIDAEACWRTLGRAVARTLDDLPKGARVQGVCLTGVTRAQVMLDRKGRSVGPVLTFRDDRALDDAAELARHFPARNRADAITAFHPLARIAWAARTNPRAYERITAVLDPKDFLNFRLTGRIAVDSVTHSRYDPLLAAVAKLPERIERHVRLLALPRVAPWRTVGPVIATQAPWRHLHGVPVFAGALDAWASAVGAGAILEGQGYDVAGTSEVAGVVTAARARVPGLVSLLWSEDAWQIGGPTQAGADCAAWCHRLVRSKGSLAAAIARAGLLAPTAHRPIFVPYLAGERAPLWRADLRGVFEGLGIDNRGDDLLWSVLEGVAMQMQAILARAAGGSRTPLREVRVAGGGAQSNAWCAMKADVMNVPVIRTSQRETGLVGAAMAAAIGLGWHDSLAAAARAMCKVDRVFEPRPDRVAIYAERIPRHARARQHAIDAADAAGRKGSKVAS